MNVQRIRGFLLQLPRPAVVRISGDGEPQSIKPGKSFAKTAETIEALDPELIECLDAEGKVLRAMRTDSADSQRSAAAAIPAVLSADPETARLTHFADLLHRAYEHSTEIAFAKLVDVMERMNERSDAIEQRLERTESANRRLLQDQVDDAFERAQEVAAAAAPGAGGIGDQMMGAFLSGKLQGPPAKPTNGAAPKGKD
jgi:hypothetical protein